MTQQTWKVWVKLGLGPTNDFIEDITIYDCPEKPGYVPGTVTLDDVLTTEEKPKTEER